MNKLLKILIVSGMTLVVSNTALAIDINAGPIWNNADAQGKCPTVCSTLAPKWNKNWRTTVPNSMSVCNVTVKTGTTTKNFDVPVGPIWSNTNAQTKCPTQLSKVKWNGNWVTTVPGSMSVCGCDSPVGVVKTTYTIRRF